MNKEKALKNQGLEFREDIVFGGGVVQDMTGKIKTDGYKRVFRRSGVRLAVFFTQ